MENEAKTKPAADFRDRVKELRRVPASKIVPNARNPRIHPDGQREAWRKVLASIGFADAVLCREAEDGTLHLIDGHLRLEDMGDAPVPENDRGGQAAGEA